MKLNHRWRWIILKSYSTKTSSKTLCIYCRAFRGIALCWLHGMGRLLAGGLYTPKSVIQSTVAMSLAMC